MNEMCCLPKNYICNPQNSIDSESSFFWTNVPSSYTLSWQRPAYEAAESFAREKNLKRILDVGCGTGYKLNEVFGRRGYNTMGLDQGSGIAVAKDKYPSASFSEIDLSMPGLSERIKSFSPQLVTCFDVIEHLHDPIAFLGQLYEGVRSTNSSLVISTPDRDALYGIGNLGPPKNPRHVREWREGEFNSLLLSVGFKINYIKHMEPRSYSLEFSELPRLLSRLIFRRRLTEGKTCMLFIASA
jgi:SAM-dependent methyltransferase